MNLNKKAIAAMSGGVDSSVTAFLLREMGYEVTGITLKLINPDDKSIAGGCSSVNDASDAKRVCDNMGIEHLIIDFTEHFKSNVMERFCNAYLDGITPNPCVDCNKYIKFDKMLECIETMGYDVFATGHYAKVEYDSASGRYLLKRAEDRAKDQSYFLYALSQNQLSKVLFPLGSLTKGDVRTIAQAQGFVTSGKKDSQDVCFIPDGDFSSFIQRYKNLSPSTGNFINTDGKVLGTHNGAYMFTIGQRKGLGIALGKPAYVLSTDISNNTVTLGDNEELFKKQLTASNINLIATDKLTAPIRVTAKIRSCHHEAPAIVEQISDDEFVVEFDEPQRAITPGQSVVLYDGATVIGGGVVNKDKKK